MENLEQENIALTAENDALRDKNFALTNVAAELEAVKAELAAERALHANELTRDQLMTALEHFDKFKAVNAFINALDDDGDLGDGVTGERVKYLWATLPEFDLKAGIFKVLSSNPTLGLTDDAITEMAAWAKKNA